MTITGIWLLTLISRTSSLCGYVPLCCNHGVFLTIIYSCKMHLEQYLPTPGEIEFIAAVSFLKCSVQQDQRPIERGRFNQIPAVLFLLPRCFPIQIAFISETFPPMVFMIVYKSHLLVEWTGGKLQGASSVFSALFTWSLIVS